MTVKNSTPEHNSNPTLKFAIHVLRVVFFCTTKHTSSLTVPEQSSFKI